MVGARKTQSIKQQPAKLIYKERNPFLLEKQKEKRKEKRTTTKTTSGDNLR